MWETGALHPGNLAPAWDHAGHRARQLCWPHWEVLITPHCSPSRGRTSLGLNFFNFIKGTHSLHHCDLEGLFGSHPSGQRFHRNQGVKVMSTGSDRRHSSTFYPPRDLRQVTYPLWASVSPSCRLSITLTPFPCWQDYKRSALYIKCFCKVPETE